MLQVVVHSELKGINKRIPSIVQTETTNQQPNRKGTTNTNQALQLHIFYSNSCKVTPHAIRAMGPYTLPALGEDHFV